MHPTLIQSRNIYTISFYDETCNKIVWLKGTANKHFNKKQQFTTLFKEARIFNTLGAAKQVINLMSEEHYQCYNIEEYNILNSSGYLKEWGKF